MAILCIAMSAIADDAVVKQAAVNAIVSDIVDDTAILKTNSKQPLSFSKCTGVASDSARLACFDLIALGSSPSILQSKQPIVLSKTIRSITSSRQLVFADRPKQNASNNANIAIDEAQMARLASNYTPLSLAYDLEKNSESGLWRVRPHNPVYILPIYINSNPNRHPSSPSQTIKNYTPNEYRSPELKFQVSLKSKMMEDVFDTNADLWFGYTHMAHWQIYNEDNSRPFRAHDYEPEVFLTQPVVADLPFGGHLRMLGMGAVHHSNGEDDPLSRSWNRTYLMAGMEWGNLTVMPRFWGRILKTNRSKPDDNPDIANYYGHGDVKFLYQLDSNNNISGMARFNPKTGKGALQLDYVYPIGKGISGYVQLFQGYGQSLIDYNHESTSVGVGVMLNDWMGL